MQISKEFARQTNSIDQDKDFFEDLAKFISSISFHYGRYYARCKMPAVR